MTALLKVVFVVALAPAFGVQTNPQAPSVREFARYAPKSPDLTFYIDVGAFFPHNYKLLEPLKQSPLVQDLPKMRGGIAALVAKAEFGRTFVKNALGFDPLTDVESAVMWVKMGKTEEGDEYVVVARGKWPRDLIERIAKLAAKPTSQVHGHTVLSIPDEDVSFAMPRRGVLLVSMPDLVKARLSPSWKSPRIDGRIARVVRKHPAVMVGSSPSKTAIARWTPALAEEHEVIEDIVLGHRFAVASLGDDALSWTWQARTENSYDRAVMLSRGMIDFIRGSHLTLRGMGWFIMTGVSGASIEDAALKALAAHRDKVREFLVAVLGRGDIRGSLTKHASSRTVHARLRGKALDLLTMTLLGTAVIGGFSDDEPSGAFLP